MTDLDRVRRAPEVYRTRAASTAGLALTSAAALTAGVVFRSDVPLSRLTRSLIVIALSLVLGAVICLVAASLYTRQESVPGRQIEQELQDLTASIQRRIRLGSLLGFSAAVVFIGIVGSTLFSSSRSAAVEVHLDDAGSAIVSSVCPNAADHVLRAQVRDAELASESHHLMLKVSREDCGADIDAVSVERERIVMIVGVAD